MVISFWALFTSTSQRPIDSVELNNILAFEYFSSRFEASDIFPYIIYWPSVEQGSPFMLIILTLGRALIFFKFSTLVKSISLLTSDTDCKFILSIPAILATSSVSKDKDEIVPLISFLSDLQLYPPIESSTNALFKVQVILMSERVVVSKLLKFLRVDNPTLVKKV